MIGLGEALRILRTPSPGEEQRGPARLRAELRHQRLCVHVAPLRPVVLFGVPCLIGCPFMTICP